MFHVSQINEVTVLTADIVRLTPDRERIIRTFVKSDLGLRCSASIDTYVDGTLRSVDLFGGDPIQRAVFQQALNRELGF